MDNTQQPEIEEMHVLVHGRVQGVYFRDFTRNHAQRLGLDGWVRNLPDGATVEILAQGRRDKLEELLERVRTGPPGASVQRVEQAWSLPHERLGPFYVRG